jgi:thioredoxin reductase (NADPH)
LVNGFERKCEWQKPIILTIDDEPQVLNAVERDLRKKSRSDYLVIKAASGEDALQTLGELHKRKSAEALFQADQRMPNMSGTEFLAEAIKIYPDAK